jgi:hypothetical protein
VSCIAYRKLKTSKTSYLPQIRRAVGGQPGYPGRNIRSIHRLLDGYDKDAFNEGSHMESHVEKYKNRFGFYPREVLAERIYCTRANWKMLKGKGIRLKPPPLEDLRLYPFT